MRSFTTPRFPIWGKAALLAPIAATLLTGCVKTDGNLAITENATLTGTLTVATAKALTDDELTHTQTDLTYTDAPTLYGATPENWSDDAYEGVQYTFNATPEQLTADDNPYLQWTLAKNADGTATLEGATPGLKRIPEQIATSSTIELTVAFPGEITKSTVDIKDYATSVTLAAGDLAQFSITGELTPQSWWKPYQGVLYTGGGIIAALMAAVIVAARFDKGEDKNPPEPQTFEQAWAGKPRTSLADDLFQPRT